MDRRKYVAGQLLGYPIFKLLETLVMCVFVIGLTSRRQMPTTPRKGKVKVMSKWTEIRNDCCDEEGKVYIDAWKTCNDNEEGKVIAKVDYKTKEVEYLNEAARTDSYAQEIINETLNRSQL